MLNKTEINKEISKLIILKRNERHLSQKALAEKTGINVTVLAKIETNNREIRFSEFVRLHNILKFNEDEIKILINYQNDTNDIISFYKLYLIKKPIDVNDEEKKKLINNMLDFIKYINNI